MAAQILDYDKLINGGQPAPKVNITMPPSPGAQAPPQNQSELQMVMGILREIKGTAGLVMDTLDTMGIDKKILKQKVQQKMGISQSQPMHRPVEHVRAQVITPQPAPVQAPKSTPEPETKMNPDTILKKVKNSIKLIKRMNGGKDMTLSEVEAFLEEEGDTIKELLAP